MPTPSTDWLARYQPWRRQAEVAFWVLVLGAQALFNTLVIWIDQGRGQPATAAWLPLAWELTSALATGALVPAIVAFERRFPLRIGRLRAHLPWHVAGSIAFCMAHVAGMLLLRQAVYAAAGLAYRPGPWHTVLAYEYLKDVRSYAAILAAVWAYRFVLLRAQGEARVLDAPEPPRLAPPPPDAEAVPAAAAAPGPVPPPPPPARPERFLVRKLRKEFLIAAADIAWLQAQGNYVGLHVNGHDYLLRSTLADVLQQLDPARFARVHRSWAVNLDQVAEIAPLDSGDARLTMKDGSSVPCSRRYRDALGSA